MSAPLDPPAPALDAARVAQSRRARTSGMILGLALLGMLALVADRVVRVATGPLPPSPGVGAPAAAGLDLAGQPLSLASLRGKVVLVDFWATWCPPCVAAMPGLARLQDELGPRGLVVLGVNQDERDTEVVAEFWKSRGFELRTIMDDGSIARAWSVFSFPTSFVVDRAGQIRAVHRGFASEDRVRAEILAALGDAPP